MKKIKKIFNLKNCRAGSRAGSALRRAEPSRNLPARSAPEPSRAGLVGSAHRAEPDFAGSISPLHMTRCQMIIFYQK